MPRKTLERRALDLLDTIEKGQPGPFQSAFVTQWEIDGAIEELRKLIKALPDDAKNIMVRS